MFFNPFSRGTYFTWEQSHSESLNKNVTKIICNKNNELPSSRLLSIKSKVFNLTWPCRHVTGGVRLTSQHPSVCLFCTALKNKAHVCHCQAFVLHVVFKRQAVVFTVHRSRKWHSVISWVQIHVNTCVHKVLYLNVFCNPHVYSFIEVCLFCQTRTGTGTQWHVCVFFLSVLKSSRFQYFCLRSTSHPFLICPLWNLIKPNGAMKTLQLLHYVY